MINRSAAQKLKIMRTNVETRERMEPAWLWGSLAIHAFVIAWLVNLIF